jgi:hypothetical protein
VLTPSAGDDVDFCVVAIFGCHLKDKGNKISQHLLPGRERRFVLLRNRSRPCENSIGPQL